MRFRGGVRLSQGCKAGRIFRHREVEVAEGLSSLLFFAALGAYLLSMLAYSLALGLRKGAAWGAGRGLALVGALAHLGSVVFRGLAAGRVPWGNMYEYSSLLGLLLVVSFLVLGRGSLKSVGAFVMGGAVLTLAAGRILYVPPGPLVPALASYWLKVHVLAAVGGSAVLGLSFFPSALFLVLEWVRRRARHGVLVGAGGAGIEAGDEGGLLGALPSSELLDRAALALVKIGFPIWTFSILAGALWAEEAWGRYWGWDPKETWSLVTWLLYAAYLHARSSRGWRGTRAAALNMVAFASLLFTYYAVNLWISGLHSYAGV